MSAARNAVLTSIYLGLSGRIQRSRYSVHQTEAEWARAVEEHARMVVLLRARDGAGLSALMRAHIRGKKAVLAARVGAEAAAG